MSRTPLESIDDYVSGHMPDDEAARFEEALFEAAGADAELAFVDRIARFGARMVTTRTFLTPFFRADIEPLRAAGFRVAFRDLGDAGTIRITPLTEDVDIVVTRIGLGAGVGVDKVDVEIDLPAVGGATKIIRDVYVDPADGGVYACCDAHLYRVAESQPHVVTRFVAVREGVREVVAVHETFVDGLPAPGG